MLTRYWRTYPLWMQFLLFVLMLFVFVAITFILSYILLPVFTGVTINQIAGFNENSTKPVLNAALLLQTIFEFTTFFAPAFLFAYLAHPKPAGYLGLRKPGKPIHWLLTVLLILSAMPITIFIAGLLKDINLGHAAKAMQEANDNTMKAFLKMNSVIDFIKAFFVLAITPAICEEFFFRGLGMRFLSRNRRNMTFPIIMSAIVFTMIHANPTGMVSIFLAGVLLGVIYYLTGSLWCSILAHMINNGLQVVLLFLSKDNKMINDAINSNSLPVPIVIGSALVFALSLYMLVSNKTPLPPGWASDYTEEELNQKAT